MRAEVPSEGFTYLKKEPDTQMVAYVAGPISKLSKEESKKRFELATEYLSAKGYITINPQTIKLGSNLENSLPDLWNTYMEACRNIIGREVPAIMFLLPDWEESRDATEERLIAFDTRMSIVQLKHDPVFMLLWNRIIKP